MDYFNIILTGYLQESNRNILDKYLLRKYREASEKHFSYDEFFNGCTDVINSLYKEMDKGLFKRKNDLYLMQNLSENGMKRTGDEPKEPSENDLNAVAKFEKELSTLNRNKFPVSLFHFTNGTHTGDLYEDDVIYIEQAIRNAKNFETSNQVKAKENNELKKPSIPDVNLFVNSMNHSVFKGILSKYREDEKENASYYKLVFDNWKTIRINEFTSSNQFGERTEWMRTFIDYYCRNLIEITIKIAKGAHLNFKDKPKWNSKYTGGFLDLFHFLDYGSGYSNTIETILMTLKLNWDEDPVLARKMQTYSIDRVKELKRLVEINFFIKKENPIFIWYDEIVTRLQNIIDFEETELRADKNKTIYIHPTPPSERKNRIFKEIASLLFFQIRHGTEVSNESVNLDNWESLKDIFYKKRIETINASYTPEEKIIYELNALEKLTINNSDHEVLKYRYKNYLLDLLENKNIKTQQSNQSNFNEIKEYHNHIFKNNAFEVWQSMYDSFKINESKRSDVKFMFEEMKKDGLIFDTIKQIDFLKWISKTYEVEIQKTSNHSRTNERLSIYSTSKQLYKE